MKQLLKVGSIALAIFVAGCSSDRDDEFTKSPTTSDLDALEAQRVLSEFVESQRSYPIYSMYAGIESITSLNKVSVGKPFLQKNADYEYNRLLVDMSSGYSSYECAPTDLRNYVGDITSDWTDTEWSTFNSWYFLVFDYHFIHNTSPYKTESFGPNGEYTNAINRTWNSLKKFWVPDNDILLFGAHGSFFGDTSLIVDLFEKYRQYYVINPATTDAQIAQIAVAIKTMFSSSGFENYSHPLLTFNAFAADEFEPLDVDHKVVMGDGIQEAYDDLGYSDVASRSILAHEYAHQMQFQEGVEFVYSPTGTRKTELMADALAAYYLTHKRGGTLNWKRVKEFMGVFFDIGDCAFSNDSHHGTPNQRMRAAKFGYDVAVATMKKGKIMPAADFIELFEDELDDIIED